MNFCSLFSILLFGITIIFRGAVSDATQTPNQTQMPLPTTAIITRNSTVQLEAGMVGSPQSQGGFLEQKLIQLLNEHAAHDRHVENVDIELLTALKVALEHATGVVDRLLQQQHPLMNPSGTTNSTERRRHPDDHHLLGGVPDEHSSSDHPLIRFANNNNNLTLFDAIKLDDLEAVGSHMRCGEFFANELDRQGYALIHHATLWNSSKVLKYLVEKAGADVNRRSSKPALDSPLHIAVRKNYKTIVKYLVEKGADVNAQNNWLGISPLHLAVNGSERGKDSPVVNVVRVRVSRSTQLNLAKARENRNGFGRGVQECNNKFDIAQYLIENGADVNAKSNSGDTPLHFAVKAGCDVEVVRYLVEHGAEVNVPNKEGYTALDLLAGSGGDVYEYLVERVGSTTTSTHPTTKEATTMTTVNYDNITLVDAIITGDLEAVRYRIGAGDNILQGALGSNGHTATHIAAASDSRLGILQYLVEQVGLPVESKNLYGHTPLDVAAFFAQLQTMKYLLGKGANASGRSNGGLTTLHRGAISRSLESVKFLVENGGADINATDDSGNSVLHFAAYANHLPTVAFLVESGTANVNLKDTSGRGPLHEACATSQLDENTEVVKYLVEKGADLKARDNDGMTPLHFAAQRYQFRTIEFLIGNGGDVNAKDEEGNSPLHLMAANKYMYDEEAMKILVENGADLDARNEDQATPWGSTFVASPADYYLYHATINAGKRRSIN